VVNDARCPNERLELDDMVPPPEIALQTLDVTPVGRLILALTVFKNL